MKYFIDTEFYEDGRTIDLISLGVVDADGREFYAVNIDAELHRVSPWVRENVLPHLPSYGDSPWKPRIQIAKEFEAFVGGVPEPPEFWGYYADYDWVVICQMFGTMMNLPERFPKFCRDLKQLSVDLGSPEHPPDPKDEHNALADARWNRELYFHLKRVSAIGRGAAMTDEQLDASTWPPAQVPPTSSSRERRSEMDKFDTEAMAIALHEHQVYALGGTPCWAGLSPDRKAEGIAAAGALIQRYMVRRDERARGNAT